MSKVCYLAAISTLFAAASAEAAQLFEEDSFSTSAGEVKVTFLGHGTLMFFHKGQVFHVDPFSEVADYEFLPKADAVLITHEHFDHLDRSALDAIETPHTEIVLNEASEKILGRGKVLKNGETTVLLGVKIEAVPAYNILHEREKGQPFHPKGEHNGYILTFGDTRFYVAGDTENTPEMKALKDIDVAFLPMNLPYTMAPEMVADAARAFRPKVLYPYHYGETDPSLLKNLLKDSGIDVRIRKMQ